MMITVKYTKSNPLTRFYAGVPPGGITGYQSRQTPGHDVGGDAGDTIPQPVLPKQGPAPHARGEAGGNDDRVPGGRGHCEYND